MMNDVMRSGFMGFGGIRMLLLAILVVLAIAGLVKYLMK